ARRPAGRASGRARGRAGRRHGSRADGDDLGLLGLHPAGSEPLPARRALPPLGGPDGGSGDPARGARPPPASRHPASAGDAMTEIRAAVCHAFGEPLSIETVRLRAPGPGEVEVTLTACAICHSDITYIDGGWGGDLPAVYGHEAAGHVSRAGAGVTRYSEGDRVLVTLIRACGTCAACASGRPTLCAAPPAMAPVLALPDGRPIDQGLNCAAFAERVVVHESQLAPVPAEIPLDAASLLSCGVITGLGAAVN